MCGPVCQCGLRANVVAWQRGLRVNGLACQRGLRANMPACQRAKSVHLLIFTCQRANFSTWCANVPEGMPIFIII